jgi:hypothetical protein
MKNQFVAMDALESRRMLTTEVSGVVFTDKLVANGKPDPGEGLAGIVITLDRTTDGVISTITTGAGGAFAKDLLPGTYDLTIDGPGISTPYKLPGFVVSSVDQSNVLFQLDADLQPQPDPEPTPDPKPAKKADLSVSVTPLPGTLLSGKKQAVPVTVTVTNAGGAAYSGPVTASVYFSKDKVIGGTDLKFGPVTLPSVKLAAGAKKAFTFDAAPIAAKLPPGTYNVLVGLTGLKGDTNASNNTGAAKTPTKVLSSSRTNLVPTLPGALKVTSEKRVTFGMVLKNTGDAKATGPMTLTLSARPVNGGTDLPLGTSAGWSFNLIARNGQATLKSSVDVSSLPPGTYRLIIKVAATPTTPESSTKDNTATSVKTFTVS